LNTSILEDKTGDVLSPVVDILSDKKLNDVIPIVTGDEKNKNIDTETLELEKKESEEESEDESEEESEEESEGYDSDDYIQKKMIQMEVEGESEVESEEDKILNEVAMAIAVAFLKQKSTVRPVLKEEQEILPLVAVAVTTNIESEKIEQPIEKDIISPIIGVAVNASMKEEEVVPTEDYDICKWIEKISSSISIIYPIMNSKINICNEANNMINEYINNLDTFISQMKVI
jgi:hypothetical protein